MKPSHSWTDRALDHLLEAGEIRGCTRSDGRHHRYISALQVLAEAIVGAQPQESVTNAGDLLHGAYCMTRAAVDELEDLELLRVLRASGPKRAIGNVVERITLLR